MEHDPQIERYSIKVEPIGSDMAIPTNIHATWDREKTVQTPSKPSQPPKNDPKLAGNPSKAQMVHSWCTDHIENCGRSQRTRTTEADARRRRGVGRKMTRGFSCDGYVCTIAADPSGAGIAPSSEIGGNENTENALPCRTCRGTVNTLFILIDIFPFEFHEHLYRRRRRETRGAVSPAFPSLRTRRLV